MLTVCVCRVKVLIFSLGFVCFLFFFFFKQKTAYEIGTGDWSSDVCSSDLVAKTIGWFIMAWPKEPKNLKVTESEGKGKDASLKIGRASCRERV